MLRNLFDEQTVKAIQKIPISFQSQAVKWIWIATSNGQISVKSAYWLGRRTLLLVKMRQGEKFGKPRFMRD